ncbi:hypothetical protein VTN02DRAFT_3303 [Thermoascus thermophilus]
MSTYTARKTGQPFSPEYRVYIEQDSKKVVSAWHDVPLYQDAEKQVLNMVVEIPRWSNAKMEASPHPLPLPLRNGIWRMVKQIAKDEFLNPIKQDMKKGQPRYTWEDPAIIDPHTGKRGDDDPLDVCELGSDVAATGQVKQVKLLGCLAVLDEGETDWKLIVIDVHDPLAARMDTVADVEAHMPTFLDTMKGWFRVYKVPDGKGENEIAMGAQVMDRSFAKDLIESCHASWQTLLKEPGTQHKDTSALYASSPLQRNFYLSTNQARWIQTRADIGIDDSAISAHVSAQPPYDEVHAHPNRAAMERSYFLPTSLVVGPAGAGRCGIVETEVKTG